MSDCAEGGRLASPQEIEWSPQKQTKETRGVRMGAGRRNQGQCKALTSRDTKEDTTAQGGAKGRRTALLGGAVPGHQPWAKPTPPIRAPLEQPMCRKCHLWSVRFSSNKV